jgi:hypothetical protein
MADKINVRPTYWKKPVFRHIDINSASDKRLSGLARSIMFYALSKPKEWKLQIFDLEKSFPQDSSYAITKAIKELAILDYIRLKRFPRKGKEFQGSYYAICEHKKLKEKKAYKRPVLSLITSGSLLNRLCSLPFKDADGNVVYLNTINPEKLSMDTTSTGVSVDTLLIN